MSKMEKLFLIILLILVIYVLLSFFANLRMNKVPEYFGSAKNFIQSNIISKIKKELSIIETEDYLHYNYELLNKKQQ